MFHKEQTLLSLTGLRFLAAFSVLVAHSLNFMIPLPTDQAEPLIYHYLANISAEGMQLFFVLSGFIIHYNYSNQLRTSQNKIEMIKFFTARFARLYPLFIICLSYDLLFKWSYSQLPSSLLAIPFYLTLTQSWFYLIINDHSLVYQYGSMPSLAWSISTEVLFYIAYPFIGIFINRINDIKILILLVVITSMFPIFIILGVFDNLEIINNLAIRVFGSGADWTTNYQDSFIRWLIYFSPYMRIFEFILGCIAASIFIKLRASNRVNYLTYFDRIILISAFLSVIILHVLFFTPGLLTSGLIPRFHMTYGFAIPFSIIIFYSACGVDVFSKYLQKESLLMLGEASYSIYLLHLPIVLAFRWETATVTSFQVLVGDILRYGLYICSALGASCLIWKIYEMPVRHWVRQKFSVFLANYMEVKNMSRSEKL